MASIHIFIPCSLNSHSVTQICVWKSWGRSAVKVTTTEHKLEANTLHCAVTGQYFSVTVRLPAFCS